MARNSLSVYKNSHDEDRKHCSPYALSTGFWNMNLYGAMSASRSKYIFTDDNISRCSRQLLFSNEPSTAVGNEHTTSPRPLRLAYF